MRFFSGNLQGEIDEVASRMYYIKDYYNDRVPKLIEVIPKETFNKEIINLLTAE
jgi:hypothetical protein